MYDYMKALQKRFDRQEYPELAAQIEYAQKELRRGMDAAERKKLLRLLDAQNALLVESKLISFHSRLQAGVGHGKGVGGRWTLFLRVRGRRTHLPSCGAGQLIPTCKTLTHE